EQTIQSAIEQLKRTADAFIDATREVIQTFEELIASATAPILAGADELSRLVTDVTTKADELIQTLENIVNTVLGAIDRIPVNALPEPMAKPAVSAIQTASGQFATQLQSGAQTASSQLTSVAQRISSAI